MVLGVCRRLLPNRQDAEDAFQVTFLVLARRASSVRPREQVGAWLHGVAYRTAMGHRRSLLRRRAKERTLRDVPHPASGPERGGEELLQAIDRELERLPEKLRLPVVLCDLEGHSLREAARQLGLPDATLANRLRLARRRLAARLREHGVTPETSLAPMLLVGATPAGPDLIAAACSAPRPSLFLTLGAWKTMRLIPFVALVLAGAGVAWLAPAVKGPPVGGAVQAAPPPKFDKNSRRERILKVLGEALEELRASGPTDDRQTLRHRLFLDMAVIEAKLGRREASRKLFKEADALIAAIQDDFRTHELRMLANALAKAGDKDEAIATARRIPPEDQFHNTSLQEAAEQLAKLRQEKDALEVMGLVTDPKIRRWIRWSVFKELAFAHARAGDLAEALRVAERLEPAAKVSALAGVVWGNRWYRDYLDVPGIAVIQAEAGDGKAARKTLEKAMALVGTITDKNDREFPVAGLACAWARLGDLAEARKLADSLSNKNWKVIARAALVTGLVKAGKVEVAVAEAAKQIEQADRAHLFLHVGVARAAVKDVKGAVESFAAAHAILEADQQARNEEAHNLVTARAMAGDDEGAAKSAEAFLPHSDFGLSNRVYAKAKRGDFAGALKLAEQRKDWRQGELLRVVAWVQTRAGQEKAVRAWIAKLDSSWLRANALFGVAEGLMNER
jgi:RNA polymerase sigma factor (sigma-70 family)